MIGQSSLPNVAHSGSSKIWFDKQELNRILFVYGRMVAAGEWRDYAIGGEKDVAVFAIFRRAAEHPLYRIEKRPSLARKQGAYAVIAAGGQVLKRGHELDQVLRVFERMFMRLVD
ncbi:MAG: DUF2794 domain-containing protein [Caulobacterales bacterium]